MRPPPAACVRRRRGSPPQRLRCLVSARLAGSCDTACTPLCIGAWCQAAFVPHLPLLVCTPRTTPKKHVAIANRRLSLPRSFFGTSRETLPPLWCRYLPLATVDSHPGLALATQSKAALQRCTAAVYLRLPQRLLFSFFLLNPAVNSSAPRS